jgi:adenosylcobyric acid synthase
MKALRPIMFVGTGSDVGKSVLNAAFCRIFLQDGYHPAPFKAQNMSLNSYATPDGLEIGRAQAVQAEACGIPCHTDMNPILLKPTNHTSSQVVLHGKPAGNKSAHDYFYETDRASLFQLAMDSCYRLMEHYNPLVLEGAGSISEMNLWDKDITNMRVAETLNAPTFLIADIDRGGVFASVYGSIQLLPPQQRNLIKGIIINKFRGDITLFEDGRKMLEEITGKPVVGVIPYFEDIFIEQEDSVALKRPSRKASKGDIRIAVVQLRHLSNFTDFNMLEQQPGVDLFYTAQPTELEKADILLLPGSKNTINDLHFLRNAGLADVIIKAHREGIPVYGICGGFQMMGESIQDPHGVEGNPCLVTGLGILPVQTTLTTEKKTEQHRFSFLGSAPTCTGYEIHMGETTSGEHSPLCITESGEEDGFFLNAKTFGSYMHGLFDNKETIQYMLDQVQIGIDVNVDYQTFKEKQYEKLADWVRSNVDMPYIYQTLQHD